MVEVIVTSIRTSPDKEPHPVVLVRRVSFESNEDFKDWLATAQTWHSATVEDMHT